MAKHVMSMATIKNKTSQNGFDLSRFNRFTAREGALQPIFWLEQAPKDDFTIDIKWRTNTTPMQSAAYVTIKENVDVFFVPYHVLFGDFEAWKSQVDIDNYATSVTSGSKIVPETPLPWITTYDIIQTITKGAFFDDLQHSYVARNRSVQQMNEIGEEWRRVPDMMRLFNLLGVGSLSPSWRIAKNASNQYVWEPIPENDSLFASVGQNGLSNFINKPLNMYPIFAYQKIYQDFYRRSQWELASPWTYNVDYMRSLNGSDKTMYQIDEFFRSAFNENEWIPSPFDLHYVSYGDDMFMSLLPRPQYGNSAVVPVDAVGDIFRPPYSHVEGNPGVGPIVPIDTVGNQVTKGLSILALRQGEALQKWKEVSLANDMDYVSQVEAHYGIKLPACTSHLCRWLGGTSSFIQVDPNFANTAGDQPYVRGNGYNSDGHLKISVDTKRVGCGDGIIMGIYYVYPLLDYSSLRLSRQNTRHMATDFAIPEFDRIGMEPVYLSELFVPRDADLGYLKSITGNNQIQADRVVDAPIGYAPRYYDYKTAIDEVHTGIQTFDFRTWSAYRANAFKGMTATYVGNKLSFGIDYPFFKVRPEYADNIFFSYNSAYDPEDITPYEADHYLVDMYIKVYASRPLDRNGLPY